MTILRMGSVGNLLLYTYYIHEFAKEKLETCRRDDVVISVAHMLYSVLFNLEVCHAPHSMHITICALRLDTRYACR